MNFRALLARADRLQNDRLFKLLASGVVMLAAIAVCAAYIVRANAPADGGNATGSSEVQPQQPPQPSPATAAQPAPDQPNAIDSSKEVTRSIVSGRAATGSVIIGAAAAAGVALVVVWLGLALTYLALIIVGVGIALLVSVIPAARGLAPVVIGILALTASFTALMQLLRLAFSHSHPVFAIARNVLAEAVRLKLSMVFIVLLIFGLAALPGLLDVSQPLRYRVQAFLQYATGGSFWIIAILTLVFAVGTVAFEQRDRTIWQTMTKPVNAWQYVLGKWLGVAGLSAILLAVCGSGIFLFTEYLRTQPAVGENYAYMTDKGLMTEDRMILESQVLTARETVKADKFPIDTDIFEQNVRDKVDQELKGIQDFAALGTSADSERARIYEKLHKDLYDAVQLAYRSIEPGNVRRYHFSGLQGARGSNRPIIFRFKINAGSNAPDALYRMTLVFRGGLPEIKECPLGQTMALHLVPSLIDENGDLEMDIFNGQIVDGGKIVPNPETVGIPPDGLELSFSVGTYQSNFLRVMLVLWIKLAFLAMLGIWAATFLSFPVACMVAFGTFLAAEGSSFLTNSLESYATTDDKGNPIMYRQVIESIAGAVAWFFRTYGDLKPTQRLVEGLALAWSSVAYGLLILAVWTGILYAGGGLIFRKRELATYSGH